MFIDNTLMNFTHLIIQLLFMMKIMKHIKSLLIWTNLNKLKNHQIKHQQGKEIQKILWIKLKYACLQNNVLLLNSWCFRTVYIGLMRYSLHEEFRFNISKFLFNSKSVINMMVFNSLNETMNNIEGQIIVFFIKEQEIDVYKLIITKFISM